MAGNLRPDYGRSLGPDYGKLSVSNGIAGDLGPDYDRSSGTRLWQITWE